MPWDSKHPIPPAKHWTKEQKKRANETANAVLREGGSEEEAIQAGIHNAGKTKHPGGKNKSEKSQFWRYMRIWEDTVKNLGMTHCLPCAAKAALKKSQEIGTMNLKDIAKALKIVKTADPAVIASLADDAALTKAANGLADSGATSLTKEQIAEVLWDEGNIHGAPSCEAIKTGPSESSSGAGAEKMVGHYSHPAAQSGVQMDAEKFVRLLEPFMGTLKSHTGTLELLVKNAQATNTILGAIAAKAEEDEEDEEESEVVEINASKSKKLVEKATKKLAKAQELKEAAGDEDDAATRKSMKTEAKALRKAAAQLLVKARNLAYASGTKGIEIRKSITAMIAESPLLKADINVVQEEEEEESDEDETKKAADTKTEVIASKVDTTSDPAKAAKAVTDDKGNQADKKDPATGNQDDAAAKAKEAEAKSDTKSLVTQDQLTKALTGIAAIEMSLKQMFDVVAGKSRVGGDMPALVKAATPDQETVLRNAIRDAEDGGTIDIVNATAARDIVAQMGMARSGMIDATIVQDRLERAPTVVRDIFKTALKAAA